MVIDENAENNDQNVDSDNDDQDEAMEKEREDIVNVLQNVILSFRNEEGMSEEENTVMKDIIEITEHKLEEEINEFKKVDKNLLKDWTRKVNAILKEIKSDNITGTNRLTYAYAIVVGGHQTKKEEMLRENPGGKEEYINQYKN